MILSSSSPSQPPSRRLALQGVSNFRDLGGYRTQDGQQLRWRQLFRSDRLSDLTQQDQAQFATLGIAHSIDFRGDAERRAHDYRINGITRIEAPIEPQVVQSLQGLLATGTALDAPTTHQLMEQTYEAFVERNAPQYRAFFEVLLNTEAPVVFHCTAGKDRTGFAAAMLLETLGVDRQTIQDDYLLTNDFYRHQHQPSRRLPEEVLAVLWRVHPNFLLAAYRAIENHHGSIPEYLERGLGLGRDAVATLKTRYLQPL